MSGDLEQGWFDPAVSTFGDRLAGAREAAGLSQEMLAARLGVKPSTLCKWEDDLSEPRANRLSMLSGMLNVSLRWLLNGEGDGPSAPGELPESVPELSGLLAEVQALRRLSESMSGRMKVLEARLRGVQG